MSCHITLRLRYKHPARWADGDLRPSVSCRNYLTPPTISFSGTLRLRAASALSRFFAGLPSAPLGCEPGEIGFADSGSFGFAEAGSVVRLLIANWIPTPTRLLTIQYNTNPLGAEKKNSHVSTIGISHVIMIRCVFCEGSAVAGCGCNIDEPIIDTHITIGSIL